MKTSYKFISCSYIKIENKTDTNCRLLTIMEELLRSLCTPIVVALKPERERR